MKIPKWLIVIIIITFLAGILYIFHLKKSQNIAIVATTSTGEVLRGTISNNVNVMGQAELANEQKLRFLQSGKISDIYVKIGDTVEENQVLAALDKRTFFQELAQVQNRIDKTQREIADEKAKANGVEARRMEREIASMERKLQEMEEEFEKLVRTSPQKSEEKLIELRAKQRELETQKAKYRVDKQSYETELQAKDTIIASKIEQSQKTLENTILTANSELGDAKNAFDEMNRIFGFEPHLLSSEDANRAGIIWSDAPNMRSQVESLWREVRGDIDDLERTISNIDRKNLKKSDAEGLLTHYTRIYKKLLEAADIARRVVDRTPVGDHALSQSELKSVISEISSLRSNISGKISFANETRDNLIFMESKEKVAEKVEADLRTKLSELEALSDTIRKNELAILTEQKEIESGKWVNPSLQREILDKQAAIQDHKDSITTKREDYAKLRSGKSDTLENLQNTLKDQLSELEKFKTKEESYEIRAPFAGTVRSINFKTGDVLAGENSDAEKTILLENSDIINVKLALNQLDIIKVELGQEVQITFDAIPDAFLEGKVTEISSTPKDSSSGRLATYEILVSAPRGEFPIYSGMNAHVEIMISEKSDVLLVPIVAVNTDPQTGENYINILRNGNFIKTIVVTGDKNNGQIEIVEWIEEGDIFQMVDFNANAYSHDDFTNSY